MVVHMRIWCMLFHNFWSFVSLGAAAKNWSWPVVVIQEYCKFLLCLFEVILEALMWSLPLVEEDAL